MKTARVIIVLAALLAPLCAWSHAALEDARPAADMNFHGQPAEVRLWFSQRIEAAFSGIAVFDQQGRQVDRKDAHVDKVDPVMLRVSLPPLPPGVYRVRWRVLSVDTHVSSGSYRFRVSH